MVCLFFLAADVQVVEGWHCKTEPMSLDDVPLQQVVCFLSAQPIVAVSYDALLVYAWDRGGWLDSNYKTILIQRAFPKI